jgi:hypothetical protein
MSDTETTTVEPAPAPEKATEKPPSGTSRSGKRRPVLLGMLAGFVVGFLVIGLVGAFLWPGNAFGPGSPDPVASEATAAFTAKDTGALEALSCKAPDGKAIQPIDGQVFGVIASTKPAGPAHLQMESEARVPLDLTITYQGQQQPLPVDLVLGEADRAWCLKGLTSR